MWNEIRSNKWRVLQGFLILAVILSVLVSGLSLNVRFGQKFDDAVTIGVGQNVVTIGMVNEAYAVGTPDYSCDGVADDVQFQLALNALPANGGKIVVLAGNYSLSANVTRALANVTWQGMGRGTYIALDGINPTITAGGNNWVFQDLRTDAGGLNMGATTGWIWTNVTINAVYYTMRTAADGNLDLGGVQVDSLMDSGLTNGRVPIAGVAGLLGDDADLTWAGGNTLNATNATVSGLLDAQTGRSATLVVAASNASAVSKAQADYVADGVADNVEINAAITAAEKVDGGGSVVLTGGLFTISNSILVRASHFNSVSLRGQGVSATVIQLANASNTDMLEWDGGLAWDVENFTLSDMSFSGNSAGQANGSILDLSHLPEARIVNVEVADAKQYNIFASATNDIKLVNVTASGTTATPVVQFANCNGIGATNLDIYKYSGAAGTGLGLSGGSESSFSNLVVDGSSLDLGISLSNTQRLSISNFWVGSYTAVGLYITGTSHYNSFSNGKFYGRGHVVGTGAAINLIDSISYNVFEGNHFDGDQGYGTQVQGTSNHNLFIANDYSMIDDLTKRHYNNSSGANYLQNNMGYIAPSEIRTASGTLTAGVANAIGFAWHDPELQDILVKKVTIEVTTGGGTVGSHLDVGIADDAAGTNRGTEFFNDLLLNNVQVNDSWVAGDGGTQTKWVFCQDSVSATDGWVVGQILDANAAALVGRYYIEYTGR